MKVHKNVHNILPALIIAQNFCGKVVFNTIFKVPFLQTASKSFNKMMGKKKIKLGNVFFSKDNFFKKYFIV